MIRSLLRKAEADSGEIPEGRWIANFGKPGHSHFDIKSESSYDANIRKYGSQACLSLGLKKTDCSAWTALCENRSRDQVINARIRMESFNTYAAAGIMFRMADEANYYSFLISNKAYFRLDAFKNGNPAPLIEWTELPARAASEIVSNHGVDFTIVAYGSHLVILVRNQWVAEIDDASLSEGTVSFAAVSYETNEVLDEGRDPFLYLSSQQEEISPYTVEALLESLTIDSGKAEVAAVYERCNAANIDPYRRFALAETFTGMNQPQAALNQILKAWENADCIKEQRHLLFAGRLAQALGKYSDAEQYISECLAEDIDSPEGKEALTEMAKILFALGRYGELKDYCNEALKLKPNDPILKAFRGHAHWNLKEHAAAAAAYDEAFELDNENGHWAKKAADAYEIIGRKKDALDRYLTGARVFLAAENYDDLGLLVPRLLALGKNNYHARALAGKWAFWVEDWEMAEREFEKAESLRRKKKDLLKDAAICYHGALLLLRKGKGAEAITLMEEATELEKEATVLDDVENSRLKKLINDWAFKHNPKNES